MDEDLPPHLGNILERKALKWIFVGGKGGVGKTTTSCSLAVKLAQTPVVEADGSTRPRKVLIISTDPAHNVSDAFNQKFTREPKAVDGVPNLEAMEIDPASMKALTSSVFDQFGKDQQQKEGMLGALHAVKDALMSLPGIDEVTVLVHIMQEIQRSHYDVSIFDTAPTGHTLRLLALPQTLNQSIDKLMSVQGIGSLLSQAGSFLTSNTGVTTDEVKQITSKFRETVKEVQNHFQDNEKTTFIPVCIPEFLPVYETERLVQELCKFRIDVQNVVVNQVIMTPKSEAPHPLLEARKRIQGKYMQQILELYSDFHVVTMPVLTSEVRGTEMLQLFGKYLMEPYDVEQHGYI